MKIPPTNNSVGGFDTFENENYYQDIAVIHAPPLTVSNEDYNAPPEDPDFSEYMWMENEEEFDKEVCIFKREN